MTLIPDTINIFEDEEVSLQLHQAPKLPFDINDYLSFELNEDFISSSGDFINDYSTSDSNSIFSMKPSAAALAASSDLEELNNKNSTDYTSMSHLGYPIEIFDRENHAYKLGYNDMNCFGEFNDDDDACYDKNYKLSSKIQPTLPSNDFKIFKTDHKDFYCQVITKLNNAPCKNKITCKFHSNHEKSKIERCDTVQRLIKNFKHLQKLNEDTLKLTRSLRMSSATGLGVVAAATASQSIRMKRYNSFNDSFLTKKRKTHQLLNPIEILSMREQKSNGEYDDDDEDEFINTLILKVSLLKTDPQERLLEFQNQTELKNLATIEYYKQNDFML